MRRYSAITAESYKTEDISVLGRDSEPAPPRHLVRLNGERLVQVLRGVEALAHLQNLQSKRPEVFQKANARARMRGWRPTNTVLVMRTMRDSVASDEIRSVRQDIYTSEGEVTFWSWDDGDDSTWEGQMFSFRRTP